MWQRPFYSDCEGSKKKEGEDKGSGGKDRLARNCEGSKKKEGEDKGRAGKTILQDTVMEARRKGKTKEGVAKTVLQDTVRGEKQEEGRGRQRKRW